MPRRSDLLAESSDPSSAEEEEEEEEQEAEDQSATQPPQTLLVVGKSHTGKSFFARNLLRDARVPVYAVNDRNPPANVRKVSWDKLGTLRNCALIVEDMISLTPSQFAAAQRTLSYYGHHHNVSPIVMVTHSVLNNKLFGLLAYVNAVYFTMTPSNAASLVNTLRYFGFNRAEQDSLLRKFLRERDVQYGYFKLDVEQRSLERYRPPGMPDSGPDDRFRPTAQAGKEEYTRTAERFLSLLPEPGKALAIFELIIRKIPLTYVSPDDLTITLQQQGTAEKLNLSLIDYVYTLTTACRPSSAMRSLDRYVRKYANIPDCFLRNKELRSR